MTSKARQAFLAPHSSELPVGRVGQPGDGAQVIAFLVGNGCATSIVVECDGGLRLI
ncbi:hypothetical protein [Burkholderia sp. BCC0322]|uniref:hypothetical protein n=1 Tax=unclassified Burkholderia TaxID=2613784 RepID=UPI00158B60B3|nr:hypothetical protein [Burkholderia sp. BCC0322]